MEILDGYLLLSHYLLPLFALLIVILCLVALLKRRMPSLGSARIVDTVSGKSYPIKYRETSIGRSKACDIPLDYPTVSRQHAVIVCAKEGWYIADSSNAGTTVNGLRVNKRADIASGDKIGVGNAVLVFENKKQRCD